MSSPIIDLEVLFCGNIVARSATGQVCRRFWWVESRHVTYDVTAPPLLSKTRRFRGVVLRWYDRQGRYRSRSKVGADPNPKRHACFRWTWVIRSPRGALLGDTIVGEGFREGTKGLLAAATAAAVIINRVCKKNTARSKGQKVKVNKTNTAAFWNVRTKSRLFTQLADWNLADESSCIQREKRSRACKL